MSQLTNSKPWCTEVTQRQLAQPRESRCVTSQCLQCAPLLSGHGLVAWSSSCPITCCDWKLREAVVWERSPDWSGLYCSALRCRLDTVQVYA